MEKKWFCESTGQYYDNYELRYVLSMSVGDTTGSQYVTCFNDQGEIILSHKAKELEDLKDRQDLLTLNNIFEEALFNRYLVTLKASEERYQDEMKFRCLIQNIEKIDWAVESTRLLEEIQNIG